MGLSTDYAGMNDAHIALITKRVLTHNDSQANAHTAQSHSYQQTAQHKVHTLIRDFECVHALNCFGRAAVLKTPITLKPTRHRPVTSSKRRIGMQIIIDQPNCRKCVYRSNTHRNNIIIDSRAPNCTEIRIEPTVAQPQTSSASATHHRDRKTADPPTTSTSGEKREKTA